MSSGEFPTTCRRELDTAQSQVGAGGVCSRMIADLMNCALVSGCPHRAECLAEVRRLLEKLPPGA